VTTDPKMLTSTLSKNDTKMLVVGFSAMRKRLSVLASPKIRDRIAKSGLGSGLNIVRTGIRKEGPKGIRGAIGRKIKKGKSQGSWFAYAGINVGKMGGGNRKYTFGFGHLVALGTAERHRDKLGGKFKSIENPTDDQLSTGEMPSNDFVKRGYSNSIGRAMAALDRRVGQKVDQEVEKLKKK